MAVDPPPAAAEQTLCCPVPVRAAGFRFVRHGTPADGERLHDFALDGACLCVELPVAPRVGDPDQRLHVLHDLADRQVPQRRVILDRVAYPADEDQGGNGFSPENKK